MYIMKQELGLLSAAVFVSSAVLLLGASIGGNFALAQDMQQMGERMMGGNMSNMSGGMMGDNMSGGMMGDNMSGGMMGDDMSGGMMGDNMMK